MVWHTETDLTGLDLIVLPGGFSYGDYLRCGAMAAHSPVMARGARACRARRLCARRVQRLPDPDRGRAAARRAAAQRRAALPLRWTATCGSSAPTRCSPRATSAGQVFRAPMAHGDGNYFADDATLDRLEGEGLVAFRYATASGRDHAGGQPQRQRPQHRRHLQPQPARARPDAASGGSGRPADGRRPTASRCSTPWPRHEPDHEPHRRCVAGPRIRPRAPRNTPRSSRSWAARPRSPSSACSP